MAAWLVKNAARSGDPSQGVMAVSCRSRLRHGDSGLGVGGACRGQQPQMAMKANCIGKVA